MWHGRCEFISSFTSISAGVGRQSQTHTHTHIRSPSRSHVQPQCKLGLRTSGTDARQGAQTVGQSWHRTLTPNCLPFSRQSSCEPVHGNLRRTNVTAGSPTSADGTEPIKEGLRQHGVHSGVQWEQEWWREQSQLSSAHYALGLRNFPGIYINECSSTAPVNSPRIRRRRRRRRRGRKRGGGHMPAGETVGTVWPSSARNARAVRVEGRREENGGRGWR